MRCLFKTMAAGGYWPQNLPPAERYRRPHARDGHWPCVATTYRSALTVKPWTMISPDNIDVVAPDGSVRSHVQAYYSGNHFFIDDMTVDVQTGDEIRRLLPNGREEAFVVTDPKFYKDGHFGSHYQVEITRRGVFDKHTGGHYTINVSGNNSRVNVGSTDNSSNMVVLQREDLAALSEEFTRLREAVTAKAQNPEHYVVIGALASAELAAKEGDATKVSQSLSAMGAAGRWVLETAKDLGVKVAAAVISQQLGLPPA